MSACVPDDAERSDSPVFASGSEFASSVNVVKSTYLLFWALWLRKRYMPMGCDTKTSRLVGN